MKLYIGDARVDDGSVLLSGGGGVGGEPKVQSFRISPSERDRVVVLLVDSSIGMVHWARVGAQTVLSYAPPRPPADETHRYVALVGVADDADYTIDALERLSRRPATVDRAALARAVGFELRDALAFSVSGPPSSGGRGAGADAPCDPTAHRKGDVRAHSVNGRTVWQRFVGLGSATRTTGQARAGGGAAAEPGRGWAWSPRLGGWIKLTAKEQAEQDAAEARKRLHASKLRAREAEDRRARLLSYKRRPSYTKGRGSHAKVRGSYAKVRGSKSARPSIGRRVLVSDDELRVVEVSLAPGAQLASQQLGLARERILTVLTGTGQLLEAGRSRKLQPLGVPVLARRAWVVRNPSLTQRLVLTIAEAL